MEELIVLRRLIDLCFLFSKKPFPVFRELAGFSQEDVLIEEPKAGVSKYLLLFKCSLHFWRQKPLFVDSVI